jgi:macrolide-specific efflux system membrane fusion protein
MNPNLKKILIISAAVLFSAAVFWYFYFYKYRNKIVSVNPKKGSVVEAVYALGTVKSDNSYTLRLMANTVIKRKFVSEGESVAKNAPLLLTDYGITFSAPFGGTITRLHFEEGETITPAVPVLNLMDLSKTHIIVSLDQQSALKIKKNQNVELSFESIRNKKLKGTVDKIYPSGGQFLVKIKPETLPSEILPEMTVDTAIEIEKRDDVILIPVESIKRGQVEIKRKDKRERIKVKPGALAGRWVEIPDGQILPDDLIIYMDK